MTTKRPIRSLGEWREDGMTLKLYGITTGESEFPDQGLVEAAKAAASPVVAEVAARTGDYASCPCGFLGIHQGVGFNFVFLCWWANGNELLQRTFICPSGASEFEPYEGDMIACIYDLAVIGFERDAFVRHVLGREAPDWDAYLAERLNTEV